MNFFNYYFLFSRLNITQPTIKPFTFSSPKLDFDSFKNKLNNKKKEFNSNYQKENLSANDATAKIKSNNDGYKYNKPTPPATLRNTYLPPKGYLPPKAYLPPLGFVPPKRDY